MKRCRYIQIWDQFTFIDSIFSHCFLHIQALKFHHTISEEIEIFTKISRVIFVFDKKLLEVSVNKKKKNIKHVLSNNQSQHRITVSLQPVAVLSRASGTTDLIKCRGNFTITIRRFCLKFSENRQQQSSEIKFFRNLDILDIIRPSWHPRRVFLGQVVYRISQSCWDWGTSTKWARSTATRQPPGATNRGADVPTQTFFTSSKLCWDSGDM